jgi:small conductance mechanosensitive channel
MDNVMNFQIGGFSLGSLLWAIVIAMACWIVIKVLLKGVDSVLAKASHLDATIIGMLRAAIKVLLIFLAMLIVMGYLGIPVTSLVALLSVAGLAISMSIQNFLSNVAGGVQLLVSRPFNVGDYVAAGGCEGTVQEIGMFYTKVMTVDNKLVQLPNSTVVATNITNYTYETNRRVDLNIDVSYDEPMEKVKDSLKASVSRIEGVLDDPAPMIRLSSYKDSTIEYVVRVWCKTEDYWNVHFDLLEEVKRGFDQDGIEMSYPHMNVHVVEK